MRFAFIAKHRGIWPVAWLCEALDISRSGFDAWLNRTPSARSVPRRCRRLEKLPLCEAASSYRVS